LTTAFPDLPPGTTELERDRLLGARAWAYLLEHPDHLLRLAPAKAAYQWGTSSTVMAFVSADRWDPRAEAAAKAIINTAWTVLCVFVVLALIRDRACRNRALFWPVMALIAYLWAIHLLYEAQSRYHLPFLPFLCMLAATGLIQRARQVGISPTVIPECSRAAQTASPIGASGSSQGREPLEHGQPAGEPQRGGTRWS
jgi:hypothetical protein